MTATRRETSALLMAALAGTTSLVSAGLLSWLAGGEPPAPMAVLWVAITLLPAALTIAAALALVHGANMTARRVLALAALFALPTVVPAACAITARALISEGGP